MVPQVPLVPEIPEVPRSADLQFSDTRFHIFTVISLQIPCFLVTNFANESASISVLLYEYDLIRKDVKIHKQWI